MKKFIINILYFSIAIISVFSLITIITDKGLRKSEYGNFEDWNNIFNKKIHADLIIQGSSRAWVQYNTYILDSILNSDSYNMGMDAALFNLQYARYKAYIQNNPHPKVIIQNLDWDTMEKVLPIFQEYQLLPYTNDSNFKETLLNTELLSKTEIYLPILKYSGQTKAIQIGISEFLGIEHFRSVKHHGYAPSDANWDSKNSNSFVKRIRSNYTVNNDIEKLFSEFLAKCKSKNTKVIFVYSPMYYKIVNSINLNDILHYYRKIADKNNIIFLDYSLDSISYDKTNFYNATHLNKKGSRLFTLKLANQLKKMGIMQPTIPNSILNKSR